MHRPTILGVAIVLVCSSLARGGDWPRFRGPNGSGVSADVLPTRWTEKDYRWQIKLPGRGHSSPVVHQESVYVTADTGNLHLLRLDAKTGRELWSRVFTAGPRRGHADNSLASATPAVDDRHVYVAWGSPQAVVLVALTHGGEDVWRRDLGPYKAGHGFAASPIVHDGRVILSCEENGKDCLVALDAATGEERWRVARKSRNTYATPCLFERTGRPVELIAVSYEDGIAGLDPATGARRWDADVFDKKHIEGAIASPIVHGELVLGTASWLSVHYETIAVRPAGAGAKVEKVFTLDRGAPLVPTPVAKDDLVFLWNDRGVVRCCDAKTGATHWSERVEGTFYASPIIAGRHVYCPSREGDMIVLTADNRYEAVAQVPLGEGTHATPAIAGGRMFIRTFGRLMCLEAIVHRRTQEEKEKDEE